MSTFISPPARGRWLLMAVLGLMLAASAAVARVAPAARERQDSVLSALLKKQTQDFSEAGQRGDAAALGRYLAPDVVFTNETGEIVTKKQIVEGASPSPAAGRIEVTHWALRRQGDVATATFIDELIQDFHGHQLDYKFQSTETWAKRPGGWKMIASHTMVVPIDPPAMHLPAADLAVYAGVYQLDATYSVAISTKGDGLVSSTNGGPTTPLAVEIRDVFFTPGIPSGRRLFQRDASGQVTGYVNRRNGNDMLLRKIS